MHALWNNAQYFVRTLGEPREEGNGLVFPSKKLPFSGFEIHYDIEKKFLGRIYVMVLEGRVEGEKGFSTSERMELRFSGFLKKGKPFFQSVPLKGAEGNGKPMVQRLNEDPCLMEACWPLDIEFLKVFFDPPGGVWKIQVRPYGGSFIQIMLPPIRYNVILAPEQAEIILSMMKRIAQRINRNEVT